MFAQLKFQGLAWLVLLVFGRECAAKIKTGPEHGKLVVCYISTWAIYRPGPGAYSIDDFDPQLCTHAIYAFAGLDIAQAAITSLDPWQDLKDNFGKAGFERLTSLKQTHSHLKVTLAIGGWNEGSKNYSILAADPIKRNQFAKQVTNFILKHNFDGLDLDWEYPTRRGGMPEDRENFVHLVKQLREEFNAHNLLLTSAIGAVKNIIEQAYDMKELAKYLDYIHLMCYDYHGSWDAQIGYNAPLRAASPYDDLTITYIVDYLLKMGTPAEKLVLGLPFYGRTFQTTGIIKNSAAALPKGFQGPYTREDGFLGYNEICLMVNNKSSPWTQVWDGTASQMLAYSERDIVDDMVRVVTYDTSRSIANKVLYGVSKRLAGVMIWSVDTDDFRGACLPPTDTYDDFIFLDGNVTTTNPSNYILLHTINEAMVYALDAINNGFKYDQIEHKESTDKTPHKENDVNKEIPHVHIIEQEKSAGNVVLFCHCLNFLLVLYSLNQS